MKVLSRIRRTLGNSLAVLIFAGVAALCAIFLFAGKQSEGGFVTLDGKDAQISEAATTFISEAQARLNRIMNDDPATTEELEQLYDVDEVGLGFHTSLADILGRRKPDGFNDNGLGLQCSKYAAYLATGRMEYSTVHPDYGPVNGKNVAQWLMDNYGFKQIAEPVPGAIGSGGFGTLYGHVVMYVGDGYVNDANYVPLTVSTHKMDLTGYIWVVPGDYEPSSDDDNTPSEPTESPVSASDCKTWQVMRGDTMGGIMRACEGFVRYGETMDRYADSWVSQKTGNSVYWGWTHGSGYGLFAGDTIIKE